MIYGLFLNKWLHHIAMALIWSISASHLILIIVLLPAEYLEASDHKSDKCIQYPNDPTIIRRPGDGNYELLVELVPPESSRLRGSGNNGLFWPASLSVRTQNSQKTGSDFDTQRSPVDYLPGREYEVTIAPKPFGGNSFLIESVYLTAVPLGTPESQEFGQGKGRFTPSICLLPTIGAIEFKYNFPRQVTFIWTSPTDTSQTSAWDERIGQWNKNYCVELRATVIPLHWHRIYFRNTGSLKRTMCPAKDVRQIEHWPNYVNSVKNITDMRARVDAVKVRSVNGLDKTDPQEVRDGYTDTGFYGAEEAGSCSLQELPKPVRRCCACNTAIYRITVQSDWQQQQHWKDWPTAGVSGEGSNTSPHFSEILGASHSPLYDVFHMGGYASPAVDALCTTSDVSKLENEFRNQAGENILTVIRTRGIDSQAPPEQRIRSALFAVNSSHHLISFLTRLVPSPDWCTGVSRINICLPNCSWPQQVQLRLEPWDAGVMSGNTYLPAEQSERLREPKPMCPITPDLRPNTPFTVLTGYAPITAGAEPTARDLGLMEVGQSPYLSPMLPPGLRAPASTRSRRQFARLGTVYLELLRINEHDTCTPEATQDDQMYPRAAHTPYIDQTKRHTKCQLTSWAPWGPCVGIDLTTCPTTEAKEFWTTRQPRMQRMRSIITPSTASDCIGFQLKEEKSCYSAQREEKCLPISEAFVDKLSSHSIESCQAIPWGPWSACINATCSRPGMIYRWRAFADMNTKRACEDYPMMSQVDICWPPPNMQCDPSDLRSACTEEPPTSVRLCVRPQNGTVRYFYHPPQRQCKPFDYVPDCHLRALVSGHRIGLTRNVFRDQTQCAQMCADSETSHSASTQWHSVYKRGVDNCQMPFDKGVPCGLEKSGVLRWYYDGDTMKCGAFTHNGCGGNENNFVTELECQSACERKQHTDT